MINLECVRLAAALDVRGAHRLQSFKIMRGF